MSQIDNTKIAYYSFKNENNLNSLYKNINELINIIEKEGMTLDNVENSIAKIYIDLSCLYINNFCYTEDKDGIKSLIHSFFQIGAENINGFIRKSVIEYNNNQKNNNHVSYFEKISNKLIVNDLKKNLLLIELNFDEIIVKNILWDLYIICYKVEGFLDRMLLQYLSVEAEKLKIENLFENEEYYELIKSLMIDILDKNEIKGIEVRYKDENNLINFKKDEFKKEFIKSNNKIIKCEKIIFKTNKDKIYMSIYNNETLISRF